LRETFSFDIDSASKQSCMWLNSQCRDTRKPSQLGIRRSLCYFLPLANRRPSWPRLAVDTAELRLSPQCWPAPKPCGGCVGIRSLANLR